MFMKKNNYFLYFCNFFMIMGMILGLNSTNWLMMWMSMEITLMFFIPCLILNKSMLESFSSLKYFIFQCMGSIFFIMGSMDFFFFNIFGLFMKLGLFPNHFWIFMISKSLSWKNFFFIMTIQKILPLMFLIMSFNMIMTIYMILLFFNSFIGNLGSLNQMDLRFLMVFSSMNHMTWMILSSIFNMFYFFLYLMMYMLLMMLMSNIFENNIFYFYQIFLKKNYNFNYMLLIMSLLFFSFLGFPPLMGFFMKLITIFSLFMIFLYFFMFFLLMQNLIISYSYIRIMIFFYMKMSRSMKMNKNFFKEYFLFFYFFIFLFFFI